MDGASSTERTPQRPSRRKVKPPATIFESFNPFLVNCRVLERHGGVRRQDLVERGRNIGAEAMDWIETCHNDQKPVSEQEPNAKTRAKFGYQNNQKADDLRTLNR